MLKDLAQNQLKRLKKIIEQNPTPIPDQKYVQSRSKRALNALLILFRIL